MSQVFPDHLSDYKVRDLPSGDRVEFEFAEIGTPTKKGEPRQTPWRAYFFTGEDGKRVRLPSVTTLLDVITAKGGLPSWYEKHGILGAVEAIRRGEIDPSDPASSERAVETVRALRLGADHARDTAATRGLNVHHLLECWSLTGEPPNLADHPVEHHGYIQGLTKWLLHADPDPVSIEELVAHPEYGFAGRVDLRARIGGLLATVDLKTQERGQIFAGAHAQAAMYEAAARRCGDKPADRCMVVVVSANGEFREMESVATLETVKHAISFYGAIRPVESACASANRIERAARAA